MKRVLYALGFGVVTYLVGVVVLLIVGTNVLSNPFGYQSVIVAVAGIAVALYVYWRIPRTV